MTTPTAVFRVVRVISCESDPANCASFAKPKSKIAMDNSLFVRRRQSVCDLHSILDSFALRQGAAVQRRAQGIALQKLGDQKRRALVLADIKHSENIGMIERGHCPRLLLETTQSIGFA